MILELILNWNPGPKNHPRNSRTFKPQNLQIFDKRVIFRALEF